MTDAEAESLKAKLAAAGESFHSMIKYLDRAVKQAEKVQECLAAACDLAENAAINERRFEQIRDELNSKLEQDDSKPASKGHFLTIETFSSLLGMTGI